MLSILEPFFLTLLPALACGFAVRWMYKHGLKAKPKRLDGQKGVISPGKISVWFTIIGGATMCVGGFALLLFVSDEGLTGALLVIFGAVISGFMLPSLTSKHDVIWNEKYIEGGCKLLGPTLGLTRAQIEWSEIVSFGTTWTSYWYLQANDGRRVYWSYLYRGHGALSDVIKNKRPDLDVSF